MKEREALPALLGEIAGNRAVLDRMMAFYGDFARRNPQWQDLNTETAMGIAQFFGNFYTCVETIIFRISRFFENNLEKDRWHSHLLVRMTCDIPGERPRVLADETAQALQEFLKFRHFTRYYFDFDYDREKLAYLGGKLHPLAGNLARDLDAFSDYLRRLLAV